MTKQPTNPSVFKSKALVCLEYIILALCLCVIALRTTFTESPTVQTATINGDISNNLYSVSISTILIFSFVLWFVWSLCGKRFVYRLSGIEIPLGIFCIAAVAAGFAAADKRLAITHFVVFLAPVLMALLLVQILDCQSKIKLLLSVIVALGVLSTYQCAEQFFANNQMTIEQYEQNPQSLLEPLGIKPNTFQHFLFEHRLYSRGVRGFFTTSNSAGSFALLASFAAVGLFIGSYKNRNSAELGYVWLITGGIAVAVVVFGLVITMSKGATIATLFAAAMFVIYLCFRNRLRNQKKAVLIICLLLALAGTSVLVRYGITYDRLPGGNSMLVRWQYWQASIKMYADHSLTGVGPGNFASFYPHYKPASALESVADPHNFVLSVLTQYGPIGLVGFLAMIFVPLWMVSSPRHASCSSEAHRSGPNFKKLAIVFGIIVSAALLFIRPIIFPLPPSASPQERQAGIIILYLMPVIIFVGGFVLAAAGERPVKKSHTSIVAALFCAVLGVVFHNLIDFAIFEPGVFTVFWVIIACLIAIGSQTNPRPQVVLKPAPFVKMLVVTTGLVIILVYSNYALIPVSRTATKIQQANQAISWGRLEHAHELLESAAEDDLLSPTALSMNGRLYLHHFQVTPRANPDLLLQAEKCLRTAIERNIAAFKNYERLTEVYLLLSETSTQHEKIDWLNEAFQTASLAVEHYPGCARLRIELAKIAERLGKNDIAACQYAEAIDIEDSYRNQFREMYPEREEIVSRLGKDKYLFAKDRLKSLSQQ